jgi:uncharacterized metal-binding protein
MKSRHIVWLFYRQFIGKTPTENWLLLGSLPSLTYLISQSAPLFFVVFVVVVKVSRSLLLHPVAFSDTAGYQNSGVPSSPIYL